MPLTRAKRRKKIRYRIRRKISGVSARPRLSVFRSNKQIYCQLIDDRKCVTLAAAGSLDEGIDNSQSKSDQAKAVGKLIADRAKKANIGEVVFDRSGYLYHGRVKALAEGARENGLKF